MKKEIALILIALGLVVGFGGGVLIGRSHPAHHYVYRTGDIMYDDATGRLCSGVKQSPIDPQLSGEAKERFEKAAQEAGIPVVDGKVVPKYPFCGEQ